MKVENKEIDCKAPHDQYQLCEKNVVYGIPFTCGTEYVGQTGRCVSVRLKEHKRSIELNEGVGYNLNKHTKKCKCEVNLQDTVIRYKHGSEKGREIVESFFIETIPMCISQMSIKLIEEEKTILRSIL